VTLSPALRRALLASLVLVTVVCLAVVLVVVLTRGAGSTVGDKLQSLKDGDAPASSQVKDREELLSVSREFATRFNTYDPSMLDDQGHLPAYASVSELMSPKFADIFQAQVTYPEKTVAQLHVTSVGTVYAVGVATQDSDSATVLVAGTIELSYPYSDSKGGKGGDGSGDGSDEQDVSTGPQRFRYEVSLVKIDGTWLVDDVDDVDDGRPSFAQPQVPEQSQGTEVPSTSPGTETPSGSPSSSTEGEQ
jgi:Mce-associated membrane protein